MGCGSCGTEQVANRMDVKAMVAAALVAVTG